jgi:hypothetical protein
MSGTTIAGGACGAEPTDPLDMFGRLRATAIETITRHVPDSYGTDGGRRCRCCGAAWPCELACRAEFTLGAM